MKILIFSTAYFPLVGGAEIALKEITDRLPGHSFELICAKIRPSLSSTERIGNITVHRVGIGHPVDKMLLPILGNIRALFISDVSLVWSLLASYGGFAALAYTWLHPGKKMLLTLQEGDSLEHYARRTGWLTFLHQAIFQRANAVQAISRFLAEWSVKMGFRGTPRVVPNGVDIVRFTTHHAPRTTYQTIRQKYGFQDSDVILVTASRLSLKNGIDDLIRSLTKLPANVKALIAGVGEDEEKLRVLTEQKGLSSRVVFAGSVPHTELPDVLRASDIFVRASLSEGLGNSFLEAMAVGIPIIGTPVGGIPDFLTDGETGVFCNPRDPDSIAVAVNRIQTEPGLREKLIQNGAQLVRERYDWDEIAKQMDAILTSV